MKSLTVKFFAVAAVICTFAVVEAASRPLVTVKTNVAIEKVQNLTVDGWFYLKGTGQSREHRLVSKYSHPQNNKRGWELVVNQKKLQFRVNCLLASGIHNDFVVRGNADIPMNKWVHLAGVFESRPDGTAAIHLYIDGKLDKSVALSKGCIININPSVNLLVGCYVDGFNYCDMFIDDLRISNRAVKFNGAPTSPVDPKEQGLLVYFAFDGDPTAVCSYKNESKIVGNANYIDGKFGKALDMTAPIDRAFYKKNFFK